MGSVALPVLTRAPRDKDEDLKIDAIVGRQHGQRAVPALVGMLKDKEVDVRLNTVNSLGKIGTEAATAVPGLIPLLKDGSRDVRTATAKTLGHIGGGQGGDPGLEGSGQGSGPAGARRRRCGAHSEGSEGLMP